MASKITTAARRPKPRRCRRPSRKLTAPGRIDVPGAPLGRGCRSFVRDDDGRPAAFDDGAASDAHLDELRNSPKDEGELMLIVRRPGTDLREVLEEGRLDLVEGLVGDTWRDRGSNRTADGSAHPEMQLNIMNARAIALVAGSKDRWPLAGDQLYIDLDLSDANLPPGTRLALGSAVIEVTAQPHTGCRKFQARFGRDAVKFVNSAAAKSFIFAGSTPRSSSRV